MKTKSRTKCLFKDLYCFWKCARNYIHFNASVLLIGKKSCIGIRIWVLVEITAIRYSFIL